MYTKYGGCLNSDTFSTSSSSSNSMNTTLTATAMSSNPISPAPENIAARWVKNLSSKPLVEAQILLLARDPDFALVPSHSPRREYIAAVEDLHLILTPKASEELRTET